MAQELCNEICEKESVEENTQKFMNLKSTGHDVKTFAIKKKQLACSLLYHIQQNSKADFWWFIELIMSL